MTAAIQEKKEEIFQLVQPDDSKARQRTGSFENRLLRFLQELEEALTQRHREAYADWCIETLKKQDRVPDLRKIRREASELMPIHANVFSMKLHEGMRRETWLCVLLSTEDADLEAQGEGQIIAKRCRDMAAMRHRIRRIHPDESLLPGTQLQVGIGLAATDAHPGRLENEWLTRLGDSMALIAAGMLRLRKRDDLLKIATDSMLYEAAEILLSLPELKRTLPKPSGSTEDEEGYQPLLPLFY